MTDRNLLMSIGLALAVALVCALFSWWQRRPRPLVLGMTLAMTALLGLLIAPRVLGPSELVPPAAALGLGSLAVLGGGPLTRVIFEFVDGPGEPQPGSVRTAGQVLRGGTWIGALERMAIFVSLMLHWPEGLALTLALKGLGRYPELRNQEQTGIAERFLIGTFVSVLWAVLCALTCQAVLDSVANG